MIAALAVSALAISFARCPTQNETTNERIANVKEVTAIYSVAFQPQPKKNATSVTAIATRITLPARRMNGRPARHHKRGLAFMATSCYISHRQFTFETEQKLTYLSISKMMDDSHIIRILKHLSVATSITQSFTSYSLSKSFTQFYS